MVNCCKKDAYINAKRRWSELAGQIKKSRNIRFTILVEQALKDPRFKEAQKKQADEDIKRAFDSFLLISVDYLYRECDYNKDQILAYMEFIIRQLKFVETDADYFLLLNEALLDDIGIDILNSSFKKESVDKSV